MRFANLHGRATIVVAAPDGTDRALDVARASDARLPSDPAVYTDLDHHDALRALVDRADAEALPVLDPAGLGAPVPRPSKGFGVGVNYRQHALETGRPLPTEPHFFAKTQNCIAGPWDDVVVPAGRDRVDFEAEVVIAFGRRCRAVDPADAWSCLAGVTVGQDISDRAEQRREPLKQFTIAKSYDTFGPIGPYLVTPDELPRRDALELSCRINGEVVQAARTDDLIFDVPALVAWLSRYLTFEPGDLVWTGTPGGVGEARDPQRFLREGDVVETTVAGIGTIRNRIVTR